MDEKHEPLLKIRFDGKAVGPGRIPVLHLVRFLSSMHKAFQRVGRVLQIEENVADSQRQSPDIREEVDLELVSLTPGSPAAILGFERRKSQMSLPDMDFGLNVLEKAIDGLRTVQMNTPDEGLPSGYDTSVLMAWREAGSLFKKDVIRIEFKLNNRKKPVTAVFSPQGFERIHKRIQSPMTNIRVVEGRLLMADFKEYGTRCRVHPSAGEPVLCLFDEEQKDEVLDSILRYVRVVGEAKEDPRSGKITEIKIQDIERLEGRDDEAVDLLPQGTQVSQDFWDSLTLEELADSQNVLPLEDARALFGTWPGEDNDGFESIIDNLRHSTVQRSGLQ